MTCSFTQVPNLNVYIIHKHILEMLRCLSSVPSCLDLCVDGAGRITLMVSATSRLEHLMPPAGSGSTGPVCSRVPSVFAPWPKPRSPSASLVSVSRWEGLTQMEEPLGQRRVPPEQSALCLSHGKQLEVVLLSP